MRLVTSCPICSTAFFVTAEQLAAHRGKVRCGQCEHVFNALDRLVEVETDPPMATPSAAQAYTDTTVQEAELSISTAAVLEGELETDVPSHAEAEGPVAQQQQVVADVSEFESDATLAPGQGQETELEGESTSADPVPVVDSDLEAGTDFEIHADIQPEPTEPRITDLPPDSDFSFSVDSGFEPYISDPPSESQTVELPSTVDPKSEIDFVLESDPDLASPQVEPPAAETKRTPAFDIVDFTVPPSVNVLSPAMIEDAVRNEGGRRGIGRLTGMLGKFFAALLILVMLLAIPVQIIYYLRSDIVAHWPATRPYLERACAVVRCTVELPKTISAITIEDSDLQEDAERQGLIHLYSTLVNHATHAVAYPLLELTLTDLSEKPLLRRTFSPQEYLPAGVSVVSGFAARQQLDIKLALTAEGESVAGYRLFVTY